MLSTVASPVQASAGSSGQEQEFASSTVRLQYPQNSCPALDSNLCLQLGAYGDVARLDTSLGTSLGSILVTYFDVRGAQALFAALPGFSQPYPAADHDFRAMQMSMPTFTQMASNAGGFAQFGEVANIQLLESDVVVEFYDMRAAQMLLTSTGGVAKPWNPKPTSQPRHLQSIPSSLYAFAPPSPSLLSSINRSPLRGFGNDDEDAFSGVLGFSPAARTMAAQVPRVADDVEAVGGSPKSNKPGRTKVTTKEFQKFDIRPEKISTGEDSRTTVMVRNLAGQNARLDFMKFLEKSGLADKYIFFYMPCKEHRNIPAGFAFVNFTSPDDVLVLNNMVNSGIWRECCTDANTKPPAVSYARFQGQDELIKHFSTSAVLREQDLDKRPIFRTKAGDLKELGSCSSPKSPKSPSRTKGAASPFSIAAAVMDEKSGMGGMASPSYMPIPKLSYSSFEPCKVSPTLTASLAESLMGA